VFDRRKSQQQEARQAQSSDSQQSGSTSAPQGSSKGRPTPSRREAEAARKQRVKPALNKREAMQRERQRVKEQRAKSRKAMAEGDERHFMPRDQGPARKFVRNFVDSRRTIAEFFLPIIVVILVLTLIPVPQIQVMGTFAWLVVMVVMVLDLILLSRKVKKEVRERFPDDPGKGHGLYAVSRATQMRRLRLPKPNVKPGQLE